MSVTYAVLTSVFGGFIYGYNTGIVSGLGGPLINKWFSNDSATDQSFYQGIVTGDILVGALIGSFTIVPLANAIGRKKAMMYTGLVCTLFAALLGVFTTFALNVVARTLLGLSVGSAGSLVPLYVSEVTPINRRGQIGTIFQVAICFSIFVAQVVNFIANPQNDPLLSDASWRLQFGLGAIPGFVLLIIALSMPESPVWSGRGSVGGKAVAAKVTGATSIWKWFGIATILAAANQLTGINAVIFYSAHIFSGTHALLIVLLAVGLWNLLSVFVSFFLVERLGRRRLMLIALGLMSIGLIFLGVAYVAFDHALYLAVPAMELFILGFEIGPGPLFFVLAAESFPASVRDRGLSFANAMAWVFNLFVSFGFPPIQRALQDYTFFLFGGTAVAAFVCVFLFVAETKGKNVNSDDNSINPSEGDRLVQKP